jgi:hypothetical protein
MPPGEQGQSSGREELDLRRPFSRNGAATQRPAPRLSALLFAFEATREAAGAYGFSEKGG